MSKRVLILSTWDNQGSGLMSYKISRFLFEEGYEVALAVRDKFHTDAFIIELPLSNYKRVFNTTSSKFKSKIRTVYGFEFYKRVFDKLSSKFKSEFKVDQEYDFLNINEKEEIITAERILSNIPFTPDLIIAGLISGFVNTKTLAELQKRTKAKVHMLTIDMSPFTGGCHYAWDCKGYQTDCSNCPAILTNSQKDRAYQNLKIKSENIKKSGIQVLTASGWTLEQAKRSTLFKSQENIHNINSCIDTRVFNNKHREYAKKTFNLPLDSKIIFTGSTVTHVKRKGISYFVESLKYLWEMVDEKTRENTFILVAGNHDVKNDLVEQIPFQKQLIPYINDYKTLSLAYQASDIFVCSSIEDSGPMMVSEALACGTPVVGFEMGVISNMVVNGYNGYKAELRNSKELADGMFKILSLSKEDYQTFSRNAVTQVEKYSSQKALIDVINQILNE